MPALHCAVMGSTQRGAAGLPQVAHLLTTAQLDEEDMHGCTALFYSVGNPLVMKLLLSSRSDVRQRNLYGQVMSVRSLVDDDELVYIRALMQNEM